MIEIKTSSKLYKLVEKFQDIFPFSLYLNVDKTFNDVCTFTRHFIYTLFSILFIFIIAMIASVFLFIFIVVLPFLGIKGESGFGLGIIYMYASLFVFYIGFVVKRMIGDKFPNMKRPSIPINKNNSFFKSLEIVSQKSNAICKKINITD